MAGKDINRSIKIYLDGSDAGKKFETLSKKADQLTEGIAALNAQGKGQTEEAKKMEKQLESVSKQMEVQKAKTEQVNKVLKNLSGNTYKDLLSVKKQLTRELQNEQRGT